MSHRISSPVSKLVILLIIGIPFLLALSVQKNPDQLAAGFTAPPESARPWVYWMWMDGNLTRQGITADLEAMQKAGIGGVVICEVNVGVPRGPVEFMSAGWRQLFKHVIREPERLGLEITLNAGPGWTGSGGPWVRPEQSMQHIVAAAVETAGPGSFDAALPQPKRRLAFFGDGGLPSELEKAKNDYYRDVAVLAFPMPTAGPTIADIDEKALYLRAPYSSQPGVKPFLPAPADFPAIPVGAAIKISRIVDLTGRLTAGGPRPRKSPSLSGFPACDAEVKSIADALWGNCDGEGVTEHAYGQGRIVWVRVTKKEAAMSGAASRGSTPSDKTTWDVGAPPLSEPEQYGDFAVFASVLDRMAIPSDFASDIPLRYTHRRDGETEIYFVANPKDQTVEANATFRVDGKQPELWDAVTGEIRVLSQFMSKDGLTSVPLRFEPHQSFFLVFRKPIGKAVASAGQNFSHLAEGSVLSSPWHVSFDPKWGGPDKITMENLEDWSRRPETGIKYYSGTAVYRKTFDLPGSAAALSKASSTGTRVWLDLGTVKNIARVRLNGSDLGVIWCNPWRLDITASLKTRGNALEIYVANLWPNRLIGDEQEPADAEYGKDGNLIRWPEWLAKGELRPSSRRLTFATWKHFTKDSPLLPSGLLGPVTIRIETRY